MKVVLLGEIKGKGGEGDVIDVAQGYAENYLFPKKLAVAATKGNLKQLEQRRNNIAKREAARVATAEELKAKLDGATVKISRDKNINALPNDIMQALYKKQTVALELEYTFEGNEYTVTIPAGKAEDNAIEWYGPLYLQMRYGK